MIFHGNFLWFMSSLRNLGQILDGSTEKGEFDHLDSTINFAVPSRKNLNHNTGPSQPFFPGINQDAINVIASSILVKNH